MGYSIVGGVVHLQKNYRGLGILVLLEAFDWEVLEGLEVCCVQMGKQVGQHYLQEDNYTVVDH